MQRIAAWYVLLPLAASVMGSGCAIRESEVSFDAPHLAHFQEYARQIEYTDVESITTDDIAATPSPITLRDSGPPQFRDITLQEAIETALTNAEVLRSLGVKVLSSPEHLHKIHDPAIQETDPLFGVEAALSEFDAVVEAATYFEKNDRALNNQFFGGGTRLLQQDLHLYRAEIAKRTATGADFTIRHNVEYDFNNSPGNDTPNRPWDVNLEAEFRQPLFQGAGTRFNRIAGPNSTVGRMNGVLLARVDTDISLIDFETGVRNLVSDVENAYWELYFAYRDLDAKIAARDRALETWRRIHTLYLHGRRGGEAEKEAQAREQYYRLQEDVENALSGRPREIGTTLLLTPGVHAHERCLRLMMGIPITDGSLLRPVDEPVMAKAVFDWNQVLVEALTRRAELRRQKWQIKRREMELAAAQNFLKPRVDAVGRYRWRGLGHNLLDPNGVSSDPFDNAYGTLTGGDFQEWQVGVEVSAPIGFRKAHAGVRNAELRVARERAILDEQQRQVAHDLSATFAELERAYVASQTNYNRRLAAKQQLAALEAVYEDADQSEKTRLLDLLLDAQRRLADAETRYYQSLVEYALAIKHVHFEKGSLLDYCEVYLAEGPWPGKAYYDACRRDRFRTGPGCLTDYRMRRTPIVSQGVYPQDTVTPEPNEAQPPEPTLVPGIEEGPIEEPQAPLDQPL